MAALPSEDRVTTHYSAYFRDPRAELRRVLDVLGISVSDEAIERAVATVSARLRHHQISTEELTEAGIPQEVIEEYLTMCSEAGPLVQTRMRVTPHQAGLQRDYRDVLRVKQLEMRIQKSELRLREREAELTSLKEVLENRDQEIQWLKASSRITVHNILNAVKQKLKSVTRRVIK